MGKVRRYGSNFSGYVLRSNRGVLNEGKVDKRYKNLILDFPTLIPYLPLYEKGEWVNEVKGSVGIFTFLTKKAVRDFISFHSEEGRDDLMIIKVRGFGRKKGKFILGGCMSEILNLILSNKVEDYNSTPPEKTAFYKKVLVLE